MKRSSKDLLLYLSILFFSIAVATLYYAYTQRHTPPAAAPPNAELKPETKHTGNAILGINTADVKEDTSSVQFANLFKSAIPFYETVPWASTEGISYDEHGWPKNLNGGQAGTKFLNRLPAGTVPDGFYTVLYDGEGEIFYGNDARLVVHRPGKDIIEISAGKDKIINASLFIKKSNPANYIRNIKILFPGGICEDTPHIRVENKAACNNSKYLSFEEHHNDIMFNPDYLNFMKDFQLIRFMNMSGMTRNTVTDWKDRNIPEKATWGGREGTNSRGAPVEVMVALANQVKAHAWFSMPFMANDDYIKRFADYVANHLDPELNAYIEYSNEVWNPIFNHHDYAIEQGLKLKLDKKKSLAGYKWYSRRSVEVFKIWEKAFNDNTRLVRVLGSWTSNHNMTSQILSFNDAYKHTDAVAIAPYFSAHPDQLQKAESVDDIFNMIADEDSKWGMAAQVKYIKKQLKVSHAFGVSLFAYEGGQHLVDWNTRKIDEHPNPLIFSANRDPRMGKYYDQLLHAWSTEGGKLFVAFSAPRINGWYGAWGVKEHIRQARNEAPKYDALLRHLEQRLNQTSKTSNPDTIQLNSDTTQTSFYANDISQIWQFNRPSPLIPLDPSLRYSPSDISGSWQTHWDNRNLYVSIAVNDNIITENDEVTITLKKNQSLEFSIQPLAEPTLISHTTRTDSAYQINIAFPWEDINSTAKTGDQFEIGISVMDNDENRNTQTKQLHSHPVNTLTTVNMLLP